MGMEGWMDGTLVRNYSKKQEAKLFVNAEVVKKFDEEEEEEEYYLKKEGYAQARTATGI